MNKKIIRIAVSTLATIIFATGCNSNDSEKKTIDSLSELSEGVYFMDCYTDYKVDDYLNANIKTVDELDVWLTKNLTHGVPTGDAADMGCSSFIMNDTTGLHLFARNYEQSDGDSLIIRTAPEDGYASIGIVDLSHINLGTKGSYTMSDEESKSLLLAAPWCICDGINEKGLGVSLLELSNKHVVNNTEKDDLLIYTALRVILDKCASIDEAVEFLNNYDMYSPRTNSYHLFVTDTSGRSVIVEWVDGETYVVEDTAVTNVLLYKESTVLDCDVRYNTIHTNIDGVESMTPEEVMELLEDVTHGNRWSAVYNLEEFSVDVCFDGDFSTTYSYSGKIE